jgi:hypothetical protein
MKGHGETLSPIPTKLVKELEELFPVKEFTPEHNNAEMMYHHGQRSVITFLKHHLKIQSNNILEKE